MTTLSTNTLYTAWFTDKDGIKHYVTHFGPFSSRTREVRLSTSVADAAPFEIVSLDGGPSQPVATSRDYYIRQYNKGDDVKNYRADTWKKGLLWTNFHNVANLVGIKHDSNTNPPSVDDGDSRFVFSAPIKLPNGQFSTLIQSKYKMQIPILTNDGLALQMDDPPKDVNVGDRYHIKLTSFSSLTSLPSVPTATESGLGTKPFIAAESTSTEGTKVEQSSSMKLDRVKLNTAYMASFEIEKKAYYVGLPVQTSDPYMWEIRLTDKKDEAYPIFFGINLNDNSNAQVTAGTQNVMIYQFTKCLDEPRAKDRVLWTNVEATQFLMGITPEGSNNDVIKDKETQEVSTAFTVAKYLGPLSYIGGSVIQGIYEKTGKLYVPTFNVTNVNEETYTINLVNSYKKDQVLTVKPFGGSAKLQPDDVAEHKDYLTDPNYLIHLEPFVIREGMKCKNVAALPSSEVNGVTSNTPYLVTVSSKEGNFGLSTHSEEQMKLLKDKVGNTGVMRLIPAVPTTKQNEALKDGDKVYVWIQPKENEDLKSVFMSYDMSTEHIENVRQGRMSQVDDKGKCTFILFNVTANSFRLKPFLLANDKDKMVGTEKNTVSNDKLIVTEKPENIATFNVVRDLNSTSFDETVIKSTTEVTMAGFSLWFLWLIGFLMLGAGLGLVILGTLVPTSGLKMIVVGGVAGIAGSLLLAYLIYREGWNVPSDAEPVSLACMAGPLNSGISGCKNTPWYCMGPIMRGLIPICSKN